MIKLFLLFQFVAAFSLPAQSAKPLEAFPLSNDTLGIDHPVQFQQPFTVVGEHAAILGSQDGSFELWLMPVQLLRNARLTARLQGYDTLIELNKLATDLNVEPDHTTITYSHAAITVRQHMFLPRVGEDEVASAIVLFEVHASKPVEISLTFDPSMMRQWPAPNFGPASGSWVERPEGSGYVLNTDDPGLYGAVAMPDAVHGDLRPYQERAEATPLVLKFSYDPKHDDGRYYPLLCGVVDRGSRLARADSSHAVNLRPDEGSGAALLDRVLAMTARVPELYRSTADFYARFFDNRLDITTPDSEFDKAVRWAEISVDQSRTPLPGGVGMTAGWLPAGGTGRPGYGWFFGRDTLWSLYAVNSYGDFKLSRGALQFLLSQQREDGKIMHELSQTAGMVDWRAMPYQYAAADATPLLLMAMYDYVRMSGDVAFLRSHWQEILLAYRFTREHTTDGVMDNSQGSGWVEDWLPHKPDQEVYLVALDAQANQSVAQMAKLMGDTKLEASVLETSRLAAKQFEGFRSAQGLYRFSRNHDGSYEDVDSIFPSVAWWDGTLHPVGTAQSLSDWESSRFTVDWGVRSVTSDQALYDPISYHRGSVWPLYTGWVAMAEYREGRSLAAYQHLQSDVRLTWLQDPGAITELLSGEFYQPLARSSSHQLWSSAMLLIPVIRGMFGLEPNALMQRITISPQLPADWDRVSLRHVEVGNDSYDITMTRQDDALLVEARSSVATTLCLDRVATNLPCIETAGVLHSLKIPLPAVEVSLGHGPKLQQGMRSQEMHVLDEQYGPHSLDLLVEAPAGSEQTLRIRQNGKANHPLAPIAVQGGEWNGELVRVKIPAGDGYKKVKLTIRWDSTGSTGLGS